MEKYIYNEQTGISYTLCGDYYLPDLTFPMKKKAQKSVCGDRGTYGTLNTTERFYISIC